MRGEKRECDYYNLRAAIPLKDLGFAPMAGKTYRGDFGIVCSDKSGTQNELRMYWANPTTGMVSDLFSESQINPPTWGRSRVDAVKEVK